jgi:hypothetical protein
MNPAVLDALIRVHVETALRKTGEWPAWIERGVGYEHCAGVTRWPVAYVTGTPQPSPA